MFSSSISTVSRATIAACIALLNTLIWVIIVFSAATPMILSGLYEASLDRNVIKDMRGSLIAAKAWREKRQDRVGRIANETEVGHYTERVHQLYAILIGNLILSEREEGRSGNDEPMGPSTVWDDVQTLVEGKGVRRTGILDEAAQPMEPLAPHRRVTATRLKGMLACQVSFGAAVGAPIVFFIGSFLFSIISNMSAVGDNNTSHALAFGMWWMTIPHVAIVSGCLLAGNNPNTLEVIVCGAIELRHENKKPEKEGRSKWYQPFYETAYTPVWMLERGRNKQKWIDKLAQRGEGIDGFNQKRRAFHLDFFDWVEVGLITIVLVVLPFVLAFLTSFYTPRVGLSCRTFTFLLYFLFQLCYSRLWLYDFFHSQHLRRDVNTAGRQLPNHARTISNSLLGFIAFGSGFTAVIGTLFQIIGVYRNCLCAVPMQY
jgi:hypothetical protein